MESLTIPFIVAQVFGVLALVSYVISAQVNTHRSVLIWRSLYNGFYAIQFLLLGAMSGFFASLIPVAFYIVCGKYDKKKRVPVSLVVLFSGLSLVFGLIFYEGPLSLLAVAHTIFCIVYLGKKDLTLFRFTQAFSSILMFVYNLYVGALAGIVIVIVQFVSAIVGIVRLDSKKVKNTLAKNKKKSRR